jgi:hypothetical protein
MSVSRKHQVHDLPRWLEIATKDLIAPAKERIQLEIEAHYAEAAAAHITEGLSESDAQRVALAELGDAHAAEKRFLKQHLTIKEAGSFKRKFMRSRGDLLANYCIFFILAAAWLLPLFLYYGKVDHQIIVFLLALGFKDVIVPTARFIMVQRKSRNMGPLLLIQVAGFFVLGLSFNYYFYCCGLASGRPFWMYGILLICILASIGNLRIWLKLRHVANVWDEILLRN